MGVGEWFNTFCGNLQVHKRDDISYRYRSITRRLNTDFWDTVSDSAHSLYVGSYGRNTAIDFSDIDMIMDWSKNPSIVEELDLANSLKAATGFYQVGMDVIIESFFAGGVYLVDLPYADVADVTAHVKWV